MNYRLNTKAIWLVAFLIVVAAGMFAYTLVKAPTPTEVSPETTQTTQENEGLAITAKHQYLNGVHTVAGTVGLPSTCSTLTAEPFFTTDDNMNVEIRLNSSLSGENCSDTLTQVPWKASFTAPEGATITATLDGAKVRLNLVPVAAGEVLEGALDVKG